MNREYHRWWSNDLGRDMDLLVFGHDGPKVLVFPTSMGRFFEYEDNKMVATLADRLDAGQLQIYCVDSVDTESWYNKQAHPYWRLQRHLQYERYILNDVIPLMWQRNWNPRTIVTGCSFGAYHALNFAFRHPDKVTDCVTMGGAFDIKKFLDGWYSEDAYFNNPPDYLANCTDGWRYNHLRTVLSTGEWDMCWNDNARMADIMGSHGIRHELAVWGDQSYHDWPWWRPMARAYLG
ncbi:MAG: alpha/beta hydrolase-fold protein [Candidatus Korobacteraceae bacterium]